MWHAAYMLQDYCCIRKQWHTYTYVHTYIHTLNKVALSMTMDDFTTVAVCTHIPSSVLLLSPPLCHKPLSTLATCPPLHPYVSMLCPNPLPCHKPVSLPSSVFIKIATSATMSISLTVPPTHVKNSLPTSQVSSEGLITKRKLRTHVKPTLQIIGSYLSPRQRAETSETSWHEVGWLEVEMVHRIRQRTDRFLHSCTQKMAAAESKGQSSCYTTR